MTVLFKLTKPNGLTRRISFAARPTWAILSTKISVLYDIAIENVGVSYVDSDGDNVTLSSDDELQDFYLSVSTADNDAIKLVVHDLGSLRAANTVSLSAPSAAPQQPHFRNTFGGHEAFPLVFEAEDEWQRLPGNLGSLFLSRDAPESPHAFVEVLESDISLSKSEAADSRGGDASCSDITFTQTTSQNKNKGKERAPTVEDDVSSVDSIIGNEAPAKPPVHVFDMSLEFGRSPRSVVPLSRSGTTTPAHVVFKHTPSTVQLPRSGAATPAQAQSTPVIPVQPLDADVDVSSATANQMAEGVDDDPPLPSLDLPDSRPVPPSLTQDVATLLTTISTVISTHPELSEHLRNIIVNATNGTYWNAHRDAISHAAESLHRTALQETSRSLEQLRHVTEQEASARVTEALGSIFHTVGEFVQAGQTNSGSQTPENSTRVSPNPPTSGIRRTPHVAMPHPRFPHLPPHPRRNHHSWFSQPPPSHPRGPFWGGLGHPHLPPPPPPPPPPHFPLPHWPQPPPPRFWGRTSEHPPSAVSSHDARAAARQVLATATEARARAAEGRTQNAAQPSSTPEGTPEDLRAEVEKAKADYKARKERYRQAKAIRKMAEQRRREPESATDSLSRQTSDNPTQAMLDNTDSPVVAPAPTPVPKAAEPTAVASEVHIVSNARGPYPQLEMFSVPKRSNATGHVPRGYIHENKETRPFNRIMRKLSDMGFTEGAYPNLNGKVMDQLLSHPPVSRDTEDDIVTNLIEELLSGTGGANGGGSGGIPGAWH